MPKHKHMHMETELTFAFRQDEPDVFWHSSAIVKRLSSHLVQTASGSMYRLIGKIEEEAMQSDG